MTLYTVTQTEREHCPECSERQLEQGHHQDLINPIPRPPRNGQVNRAGLLHLIGDVLFRIVRENTEQHILGIREREKASAGLG